MKRIFSGRDEIRFHESARAAAEEVAAALPELRRRGEEITGCRGPRFIRVVICERLPAYQIFWFQPLSWLSFTFFLAIAFCISTQAFRIAISIFAYLFFIIWLAGFRSFQAVWPYAGGLTIVGPGFYPVIAVHWPRPVRSPAAEALSIRHPDSEALRMIIAHEYAHCLLRVLRKRFVIIAWLDEGFAFWFMEQATGLDAWKPESRACVEEPDEKRDPRRRMKPNEEHYIRLMARYYWEVKALEEEGKLLETLTASKRDLVGLRPKLRAEDL